MYEIMAMIKSGHDLSREWMRGELRQIRGLEKKIEEDESPRIKIREENAYISIDFNNKDYVVIESKEIADKHGIDCTDCVSRFEISGKDEDMLLFNDFLLLMERLENHGAFVLFDKYTGKLYGK